MPACGRSPRPRPSGSLRGGRLGAAELPVLELVDRALVGLALLLAIGVDVGVRQDAVQPRLEVRALRELRPRRERLDEGLLHEVGASAGLRVMRIAAAYSWSMKGSACSSKARRAAWPRRVSRCRSAWCRSRRQSSPAILDRQPWRPSGVRALQATRAPSPSASPDATVDNRCRFEVFRTRVRSVRRGQADRARDGWRAPVAVGPLDAVLAVPGSKSLTNRELILAALADGPSTLRAPLYSATPSA